MHTNDFISRLSCCCNFLDDSISPCTGHSPLLPTLSSTTIDVFGLIFMYFIWFLWLLSFSLFFFVFLRRTFASLCSSSLISIKFLASYFIILRAFLGNFLFFNYLSSTVRPWAAFSNCSFHFVRPHCRAFTYVCVLVCVSVCLACDSMTALKFDFCSL